MENVFRLFGGKELKDLGEYVKQYIEKNPDVEIFVGTDSRQYKKNTKFVTVVGLLKPRKGVHIVYKKVNIKKIKDIFSRLWNEVEYSREISQYLESVISKDITIHLDIQKDHKYKSSMLHDNAVGYLKGLGYRVETKPDSWAASTAADMLCR
ncbi:MAG: hypothetical protein KDH96_11725 [Candidatus Riesia sp.]|nr:hypothetical protein [Candidatus Riesia sp.]